MREPSKFREWFEAQHGKRPGPRSHSDQQLSGMVRTGERARHILAKRAEWDARFESALYAWQVKR